MKITVALIRHGKTEANIEGRYAGGVDYPLCETGLVELEQLKQKGIYPKAELVFSSPMTRCLQTSKTIYKDFEPIIYDGLAEIYLGEFEGKTHDDLKDKKEYIAWIDSGGKITVPGGEDGMGFIARCQAAFEAITDEASEKGASHISIICHGGTIMAIISKYMADSKGLFGWQAENGGGYIFNFDTEARTVTDVKKLN